MTPIERILIVARFVLAAVILLAFATSFDVRRQSASGHDLWMVSLPFGAELDYQQSQRDGGWALFFDGADGGSWLFSAER